MPTFGAYDLIAPLATGGMAQLWLARSPGADGIVVLKRLLREHLGEADLVAMFDDEAQLGAMLRHANIVRQYEHGAAEGEPYIVLEYLQGENVQIIRRTLRKKKVTLPLEVTIEILRRLCDGLHATHELRDKQGRALSVVHRDVSPQNTIVTFDGLVKVVDFGIAKRKDRLVNTRGGTLKGKVPYMAAEQIQSGIVDRRTDIYAVGVMLYELTLGTRPYAVSSTSEFALMMAITRGEIKSPRVVRPDYSPRLEALLFRTLSPQPDRRPPTAADLAAELDAFRRAEGLPEGPQLLRGLLAEHFAERIEGLRKATNEQELVERILDAEKRRGAQQREEDGEAEVTTSPRGADAGARPGAAYSLTRRPLGGAMLAALQGRINETFDGGAVGSALSETPLSVLDLAGVLRLTSYGVREWQAMLESCRTTELWLARCSEAILAQLATIRGFAGHARVASLLLPFHCERCGESGVKTFDMELDAEELASGRVAPIPCKHCAGEATFDGDASWLLFGRPWLGEPVPAVVRGALTALQRDSAVAAPPLEKVVLGTETLLRIRDARGPRVRFRKLLDGVEGHLRVEVLDPTALDERAAADLARALATLGPEVTTIEVRGAPAELWAALRGKPRVRVVSRFFAAHCPACDVPRVVVAPVEEAAELPPCVRCSGRLVLSADPEPPLSEAYAATPEPAEPAPPALHAPPAVAPVPVRPPAPRARTWLILAASALTAVGGWQIVTSARPSPDPAPAAAGGVASASTAPRAAPRGEIVIADGHVDIIAEGAGASEDEALSAARAKAHGLLLDAVKEALPPEVRAAIEIAKRPTSAEELARRWGMHFGAGAGLARASVQALPSASERALSVRFRIAEASFRKAIAYFGTIEGFLGLGVVPAFPEVADAGFLVVTAAAGNPAVRVGDVILAVDDRALLPSDRPSFLTLSSSAAGLRLARGDTVPWRWP